MSQLLKITVEDVVEGAEFLWLDDITVVTVVYVGHGWVIFSVLGEDGCGCHSIDFFVAHARKRTPRYVISEFRNPVTGERYLNWWGEVKVAGRSYVGQAWIVSEELS